jgi:hypothetical protein
MKHFKSYNRFLRAGIFLVMVPFTLIAQETISTVDQEPDSLLLTETTKSRHALYTSIGFGNDMLCMGSSISQEKPYYYGSLSYGFNNELFASATTYHMSAFDPFLAFHTFSINYSHVFNSWFDISTSVSKYQVAEELSDTLFSNFFYGDLTLGFDWKLIYSKLSVSRIFSDFSSNYFQLRNSRYFQTPEFFNKKANISFDPYATMLFGTLTTTMTSEGTTVGITPPYRSTGGSGRNSTGTSTVTTTTSTSFGLIEIDLGLPIAINTDFLTIEAEPGFVIPMYSDTELPGQKGFVFFLSCYFKIF